MKFLKKTLKSLLLIMLTTSLVLEAPFSAFGSWHNAKAANSLSINVTNVEMYDENGKLDPAIPIEIEDDTVITLGIDWSLPEGQPVADQDLAIIPIPTVFLPLDISQAKGNLIFSDPDNPGSEIIVGTYAMDTSNNLILTYNDKLSLEGDFGEERKGTVKIEFKINVNEFQDNLEKKVEFGDMVSFTIAIKPQNPGSSITKNGAVDSEANPKFIDWTIDVNTKEEDLQDAIVSDIIPTGLSLVTDSVEIYNLNVGYQGVVLGSVTGGAIQIAADEKSFQIDLDGINSAYRIKYRTKIDTYGVKYTNEASVKDGDAGTPITVSKELGPYIKASALEKKSGVPQNDANGNTRTIKWTLDVNKLETDIGDAIIEDQLDSNQSMIESSVKIYRLIKSGSNWIQGSQVTLDSNNIEINSVTGGSLKVKLGTLAKEAYQITYETQVNYPDEFVPKLNCSNTATLKDGIDTIDTATNTAKAVRNPLMVKTAVSTTVDNYSAKTISWKLTVNGGEHSIRDALVHDNLPEGLTLDKDSIVIKDAAGVTIYSKSVANSDITVLPGGSISGPTEFTIDLGDISNKLAITYDTIISPDKYGTNISFENSAWLTASSGIGTGSGKGSVYDVTKDSVTPQIRNTFAKNTITGVTIDNIVYDSVNYSDKTMSWMLTIKPMKEDITQLVITDTFPSNGLIFQKNTLKFKKGNTVLNWSEGVDYSVTPVTLNSVYGYQNGFILTINKTMSGSDYTVYYKTSFDRDAYPSITENTSTGQRYYENKAEFVYSIDGTVPGISGGSDTKNYQMDKTSYDNGEKVGNADLQGRTINWKIYANDQAKELNGDLVITDKLTEGNHQLSSNIETELTVKEYTVNSGNNNPVVQRTLTSGEYTLVPDLDNKGFTLTIPNATQKRYLIEYTTDILGVSDQTYTNVANFLGKDYTAKVQNSNYNKFLEKTATNVGGTNQVSLDDEIDWKVVLNKSLSEVKNAVFTDVISGGHQYVTGSLKVYQVDVNSSPNIRTEVDASDDTYKLIESKNPTTGEWTITVEFSNPITRQYELEYSTIVTSKTGTISNSASFTGTGVTGTTSGNKTYTITQSSSGTGTGTSSKGTLVIEKRDAATGALISSEATFGLYYVLNGEQMLFSGQTQKTVAGKLTYTGVPVRKNYQLKELSAPTGYIGDSNIITVTGLIARGTVTYTVLNEKQQKQLKVTKVDSTNSSKKLGGAVFELYKLSSGAKTLIGTYTTSASNGEFIVGGLENGDYQLVEVTAPDGYQLPENPERNITIDLDSVKGDGTADNTLSLTVTNAPLKSVIIQKVDDEDTSKGLEGAEFELRKANSNELIQAYETDNNGYITLTDLGVGSYKLIETKAPSGYSLPENSVKEFTITHAMVQNDASLDLGKIINERLRSIRFMKVDKVDSSLGLGGAVFELRKDDHVIISNLISQADGTIEINNLTKGSYTLVEKTPPVGYQLPADPSVSFSITKDMPAVITGETIENEKTRSLTIKKVDSQDTSKTLANAEFKIKAPDGSEVTVTTGNDGTVTLNGLIYGEYIITEVKAPQGYNLNNNPVKVTLDDSALVFTAEIKNVKYVAPPVIPGSTGSPGSSTPTPVPTSTPEPSATPKPTVSPGITVTPKPTPAVTPKPEPTVKPTQAPTPTPKAIIEITTEDTPKGGSVPLPQGGTSTKGKEPEHGTVKVDDKGKWTYKPNPGFTGDDDFSVIVTGPKGDQEEIFIDINVDEIPLSGIDTNKYPGTDIPKTDIPKTGEEQYWYYILAGLIVSLSGFVVISGYRRMKKN